MTHFRLFYRSPITNHVHNVYLYGTDDSRYTHLQKHGRLCVWAPHVPTKHSAVVKIANTLLLPAAHFRNHTYLQDFTTLLESLPLHKPLSYACQLYPEFFV